MIDVAFSDEFKSLAPDYRMLQIEADVEGGDTPEALTEEINRFAQSMQQIIDILIIRHSLFVKKILSTYN